MRAFGLPGMDPLLTVVWGNCGNAIVLSEVREFIQKGERLRLPDILLVTLTCVLENKPATISRDETREGNLLAGI